MASRSKQCGWPDCKHQVPAHHWACRVHFPYLPNGLAHRLKNTRHWWPEWKVVTKEALDFARAYVRPPRIAKEERKCLKCGGEPSHRLNDRYCVPCHIALITGDRDD